MSAKVVEQMVMRPMQTRATGSAAAPGPRWGGWRAGVAALAAVALVAGCNSNASDGTTTSGAERSGEAPLRFDTEPAYALTEDAYPGEWPAAVLYQESAFLLDQAALAVFDVTSGEQTARIEPERPLLFDPEDPDVEQTWVDPPLLTEVDGDAVVLAGFVVEHPSDTAGRSQFTVELVAVDADTGEVRWRTEANNPLGASRVPQSRVAVSMRYAQETTGVAWFILDGAILGTFGFALDEPGVTWADPNFIATTVHDGVVAGQLEESTAEGQAFYAAGMGLEDGAERWRLPQELAGAGAAGAGPWMMLRDGAAEPAEAVRLVAVGTQETSHTGEDGLTADMYCMSDDTVSVVVCTEDDNAAIALDTETGETLWAQPPGSWDGRAVSLWRGALYVSGPDGPVVLHARDGGVLESEAGVAPAVVNEHAGLVQTGGTIHVHHVAD